MPFNIQKLSVEEIKAEFKREGTNVAELGDYVDLVKGLSIGEGFTVKVQEVERDGKYLELVPDTADSDGNADTVRAFKRRMNAAADSINIKLKWKPKGHHTGGGDDARFVTDWLTAKALESKAESSNGSGK